MRELGVSVSLYMIGTLLFFVLIPERLHYLAAMQNVTASYRSAYNDLLKVYRESDEAEERGRVLSTLCFCKDENIVLESLNLLFTNEFRKQDAYYVLQGLDVETRDTAWVWLKDNWDRVTRKYGDTQAGGFIRYVVHCSPPTRRQQSSPASSQTRKKPEFERTLKQSLENGPDQRKGGSRASRANRGSLNGAGAAAYRP
ncbi:Aminopeptidase M1-C [Zea mays]|uniref:Aminopeptidase M1-C n=1 Tax=Zea mays TaxID=4577 RepID=A0A3L6E075_MAIZE|nr:Aminopeptidase M1-C [Zea mays]